MPLARVNGTELYYEETGQGCALVWSHEFAGDYRSWEPQVRHFSRRYRVITYNHRGYPQSAVPDDPAAYRNEILVEDLHQLLRHLGIAQAHVGGLSMGANVALNFGLSYPQMCRSLIIAACGSGTVNREQFLAQYGQLVASLETRGIEAAVERFSNLPSRRGFREKDPRGFAEFIAQLSEHPARASACLMRGVVLARKTIFELETGLKALRVPTLIVVGDQDEPCLEPGLFMKRVIPHAGLVTLPMSGHTMNVEEPGLFNLHVGEFLSAVESGQWGTWRAGQATSASQ
ncbi:MAG: alpha/beta hydrolase [Candidatus Rokubacteria bacterium]|nr:alpha/beta hydrolase [Candidatus Rokubacteria bacterium]